MAHTHRRSIIYQKITLAGFLGRDPELKYLADGTAVTSFSVATTDYKKNTYWFRVNVWGKQAESCNQYLKKGSKVLVDGSLQGDPSTGGPRIWTGKDGSANASFEIRANEVKFLSSRNEDTGQGSAVVSSGQSGEEDGIPF